MSISSLRVFIIVVFLPFSTPSVADTNDCLKRTVVMGQSCGSAADSMRVVLDNQCNTHVRAEICFVTMEGKHCEWENVYQGDPYFVFEHCNTTGHYELRSCVAGNQPCDKAAKSLVWQCSDGRSVRYSFEHGTDGSRHRIKTEDGSSAVVLSDRDPDTNQFVLPIDRINWAICERREEDRSLVSAAKDKLLQYHVEQAKQRFDECLRSSNAKTCHIRIYGSDDSTVGGNVRQ